MLFSHKNDENSQPKKRSIWGTLFNPRFGDDIRPMGDSLRFLSQLLASMFAANGLFPKDHPALTDPNGSLSFSEVIATAWSSLRWTKENTPQIVFFAAVMSCLGFGILVLIAFLSTLFVGSASAAEVAFFSPPDPTSELSSQWLDYLFLNKPVYNSSCELNTSTFLVAPAGTSGLQAALQGALAFFSRGMLICAGFILIYHLTVMIVETAHSGKFMGRANQIWAPIRLVVAIGLLVPISTGNGLNLGQYLVLQVARWGSAMASQVWYQVVDNIAGGVGGLDLKIPPPPNVIDLVNDVVLMRACETAFNASLTKLGLGDSDYRVSLKTYEVTCPGYSPAQTGGLSDSNFADPEPPKCTKYSYMSEKGFFGEDGAISCGSIFLSPEPTSETASFPRGSTEYAVSPEIQRVVQKLYASHLKAFQRFLENEKLTELGSDVLSMSEMQSSRPEEYKEKTITELVQKRDALINTYRQYLVNDFKAISSGAKIDKAPLLKWTRQGWVTAGAWINTVVRAQGAVYSGGESPLPKTAMTVQDFANIGAWDKFKNVFKRNGVSNETLVDVGTQTRRALIEFKSKVLDVSHKEGNIKNTQTAKKGLPTDDEMPKEGGPMEVFFSVVNRLGAYAGLWPYKDGMSFQFGATANPLSELAYFGYASLHTGFSVLAWAGVTVAGVKIVGALIPTGFFGSVATLVEAAASFALFLGLIFVTAGISLAFMVPLIPFIKFFFNVLTWLLIVFEAVVAVPLWALAHLTPYGDGFAGNQAAKGYQYLFSLLLRPTLLVMGLIAGFLFFFVSINFLNICFSTATAGSGSLGGALEVVAKIMFTVMYVVLSYICANKCFQTISFFAEHAMNWFGGASLAGKPMGDAGKTFGAIGLASGYLGKETLGQMQNLSGGVSGAISKSKALKKEKADQLLADKTRREDQNLQAALAGKQLERDASGAWTGGVKNMPDPSANLIASAGEEGAGATTSDSPSGGGGAGADVGGSEGGAGGDQPTIILAGANNPRDAKTQKEKERIRKENEAKSRSGRSNTDGNKA